MNVFENVQMLHSQTPLFWAAAAAVALGATLLVTAGWVQLRRWRGSPGADTNVRQQVTVTADGYSANIPHGRGAAPAAAPAVSTADAPPVRDELLPALGVRLADAADRLEAVRSALAEHGARGSSLKETPSSVDYVFRSGAA